MRKYFQLFTLGFLVVAGSSFPARAESGDSLIKKGYKVSQLTTNKAGKLGWNLNKDGTTFFCGMKNVGMIKNGKNGMVSFTSSGRVVKLDKATVLKSLGWKELPEAMPDYVDLKAGRITGRVVSGCRKIS
tara:strand:- start:9657 stop:10046 length:390 start_codon:yes stop_codon:yes gene_type:complete